MKNFIASIFLGIFMMLGVVAYANASNSSPTNIEFQKYQSVFLNDIIIPGVSPQYGSAVYVHTISDKISGYKSEITPKANSPPKAGITELSL